MAYDDVLVDDVDTIDAVRWNSMITALAGKSVTAHAHDEFHIYPYSNHYYIYTDGSTYYAKNMSTGAIDYSGISFDTVFAAVVADISYAGFIKLGKGFFYTVGLATGYKSIIIEGSGWGIGTLITSNPGTVIMSNIDDDTYLLTLGEHGYTTEGAGIRNLMFCHTPAYTKCLGAVDLYNTVNSFVDHCYFGGFEAGTPTPINSISIRGATDELVGGWCNHARFNHIVNPDIGINLGANANYCVIEGNNIEGSGTGTAHGIKCDGTGASTASPYGCMLTGNRIRNFDYGASRGLWITAGSNNSGRHTVSGNVFNENAINYEVTSGTGIGECTFVGNVLGAAGTSKALDSGNVQSYYYNNKNYVRENWGAVSKANGDTVTHSLDTTPTSVVATGTVANEVITVTAIGTTTFTVSIKKFDPIGGVWTAGTTQTIYWRAWI